MDRNNNLPEFIVLSPSKSGTNTLFELLNQHPEICMAQHVKGTRFFNRFHGRGLLWYSQQFSHCPLNSVKGEVDETYFVSEDPVPERIYNLIPDIKLILCLRNPMDRAVSLYGQFVKFGLIKCSFDKAIKDSRYHRLLISDNYYSQHLKRYQKYFPEKNILIFSFEDFTQNTAETIKNVYSFLDIDSEFIPVAMGKVFNPAQKPRFALLNSLAYFTLVACRHLGLYSAIGMAKKSRVIQKLLFRKERKANSLTVSPKTSEDLRAIFHKYNTSLSKITNLDLTPWNNNS